MTGDLVVSLFPALRFFRYRGGYRFFFWIDYVVLPYLTPLYEGVLEVPPYLPQHNVEVLFSVFRPDPEEVQVLSLLYPRLWKVLHLLVGILYEL